MPNYFKGFGNSSNSNGQYWYGDYGFLYKKNTGSGARKNPMYGLICNRPTNLYNKYIPGAGVGGVNSSVRRAKMRLATSCNKNQLCGRFYQQLSTNWDVVSPYTVNQG
jgi:hypothetical protein